MNNKTKWLRTMALATLLPLLSAVAGERALAAQAGNMWASTMKSTHEVRVEKYTAFEDLRKGDAARIAGLRCRMNADALQHEKGFSHQAVITWAGPLYPGSRCLLITLAPCEADIANWEALRFFLLDQKEGPVFRATDLRGVPDTVDVRYPGGKGTLVWREMDVWNMSVSCRYQRLESPFGMWSTEISYGLFEFLFSGAMCPEDGFERVQAAERGGR